MNRRTSRKITREATAAAVRTYSEDLTESERLAIETRCEEDPVFKARFVEAHHLLNALDDWRDELREDSMYRAFSGRPKAAGRHRSRDFAGAGLAAGVLLAIAVLLATSTEYFTEPADPVIRHATAVGERETVTLEDGSIVTLNTGSEILVGMTDAVRRVVMDRGEAYFEVARDPLRPFTVEVGGQSITAHGTEFNLRRLDDGFMVALVEGRLALHWQGGEPPADPPWLDLKGPYDFESAFGDVLGLEPGTVLQFDARDRTVTARHETDVAHRQQWRQGRLSFRDEPMSTVVDELGRYSPKPIRIRDPHVGDIRVFATLRLDSIEEALQTLENAMPIRVVPTGSEIVIVAVNEKSTPSSS